MDEGSTVRLMCRECGILSDHTMSPHCFDFPQHVTRILICQTCKSIVTERQTKVDGIVLQHLQKIYCPNLRHDYRKEEIRESPHIPKESYILYEKAVLSYNNGHNEACLIYLVKLINSAFDNLIDRKFKSDAKSRVEWKELPLPSKVDRVNIDPYSLGDDSPEMKLKSVLKTLISEYETRYLIRDKPGRDILSKGIKASEKLFQKGFIMPGQIEHINEDILNELDPNQVESGLITISEK